MVHWRYDVGDAQTIGKQAGWNIPIRREELAAPHGIPFQQQVEHLARVSKGMEAPRCSGKDGLSAVRVCEAVIVALEAGNGSPIDVQPS